MKKLIALFAFLGAMLFLPYEKYETSSEVNIECFAEIGIEITEDYAVPGLNVFSMGVQTETFSNTGVEINKDYLDPTSDEITYFDMLYPDKLNYPITTILSEVIIERNDVDLNMLDADSNPDYGESHINLNTLTKNNTVVFLHPYLNYRPLETWKATTKDINVLGVLYS